MAKRKDATRVQIDEPLHMILPYIMPHRTEAEVSSFEHFDVTNLVDYIDAKRAKGSELKLFHCICYAVAKTIYHRPLLNRFIAGKYYWQRNDISLSFNVKQKFKDDAQESLMFLYAKPEMTLDDVSKLILGDVNQVRHQGSNDIDGTMKFVGKLPRFIITFLVWVLKRLDFHGHMIEALSKGDPNFSTVLLSNLGSIGAGAPYHHLNNYGTTSIMITIGTLDINEKKATLDMTFNLDERIADGFYFAKSLRYIKYLFEHPEEMEKPISAEMPEGIIEAKHHQAKVVKEVKKPAVKKASSNKKATTKKTTTTKKATTKKAK